MNSTLISVYNHFIKRSRNCQRFYEADSVGRRTARAISYATGCAVTCTADGTDIAALRENWSNITPSANVTYTISYNGTSYTVCVNTKIVKNISYSEILD